MTKRKSKVRRSKAAEGTRGKRAPVAQGGRLKVEATSQAGWGRGFDSAPSREHDTMSGSRPTRLVEIPGVKSGPRAPSPLDIMLMNELLGPTPRERWMMEVERVVTKFVGELNEIEKSFETISSEVRSPLCN